MASFVGALGSIFSAVMAVPQASRAIRVGVEGVSALTFQFFSASVYLWLVYDGSQHYWIAFPGIISQILSATVVLSAIYFRKRNLREVLPVYLPGVLITLLFFLTKAYNLAGWCAVISASVLLFPQLRDVFVKKNISGVSLPTWLLFVATGGCWFAFGALKHDPRLMTANGIWIAVCLAISFEVWRKRRGIDANA